MKPVPLVLVAREVLLVQLATLELVVKLVKRAQAVKPVMVKLA